MSMVGKRLGALGCFVCAQQSGMQDGVGWDLDECSAR